MRISSGVHSPHSRQHHSVCRIVSEERLFFGREGQQIFASCTMFFNKRIGLPLQLQLVFGAQFLQSGSSRLSDRVA